MKMSGGVEWALHCCVLLSAATEPVAAAKLAELHDASPTYMAKQLQLLSRAGLVRSAPGQSGGYLLTRPATEITVLDVVEAIDGSQPAFRCTEVRQRGPMAIPAERCDAPCPIAQVMESADHAWRDSLRAVTIGTLAATVTATTPSELLNSVSAWLSS
ncbi:Rrf2 family transcriptional regulator [Micromonospora chokoriensis]